MSLLTRIKNTLSRERVRAEIDEELQSHLEEAAEAGRDAAEANRALGNRLLLREASADAKLAAWLDNLRADVTFSLRLLLKNRVASAAAVLSLALTIGTCTGAFRLLDALLLRPLAVNQPELLHFVEYEFKSPRGERSFGDILEYPLFVGLREKVADVADVVAITSPYRTEITYGKEGEEERASRLYVSGNMFASFGLKPALGRLLTPDDDRKPGGHPVAVISHAYWTSRFAQDPRVLGKKFVWGQYSMEIVGVAQEGFHGTETGRPTDIFIPTMMNKNAIPNPNWSWHRIWVKRRGGASVDLVRDRVAAFIRAHRQERTTEWKNAPASKKSEYINATIRLTPAAAGVSQLQREYGRAIWILAVLAVLLLLIACANVANLMLAQAAARSREMALRVSIGAGAGRLIQLVMMESVLLALAAAALGGLLAWWMAPFLVAQISGADNPVELFLAMDWRVVGFAALLSVVVVCLFGLPTALRAGAVHPMSALRAGTDSRGKRRLMHVLVAAQVALCLLVHLVAGLFLATYDRLSNVPLGFVSDRVLTASFSSKEALPPERWEQLRTILAELPGVEQAAMSSWPLLSGNSMLRGVKVEGGSQDEGGGSPYALGISPGFLATMRMKLLDGRDFRPEESLGAVAIVNESFARRYFPNVNPIGRTFQDPNDERNRTTRIVGLVNDARYDRLRNDFRATVYTPLRELDAKGVPQGEAWASYSIRTKLQDPLAMAPLLRAAATRVAGDIRVGDIETQQEIIDRQLVRERLVAALSFFFAAVALLLAAVGLYGVLHFSVLQRRREIGIRMALGAPGSKVAWSVARDICLMLLAGSGVGLALGMASERYLTTLLFQVKPSEWQLIAAPLALILVAAVMAALAPIARAVRIDPAQVLRAE